MTRFNEDQRGEWISLLHSSPQSNADLPSFALIVVEDTQYISAMNVDTMFGTPLLARAGAMAE